MKHDIESVITIRTEWKEYTIVFATKKLANNTAIITQFLDNVEIVNIIPPKNFIELNKPKTTENNSTINTNKIPPLKPQVETSTIPLSRKSIAMNIWNVIKDRLNNNFTIDDFEYICVGSGYDKDIRGGKLYDMVAQLVKLKLIRKVLYKDGVPIRPLTYEIIEKESATDYLKYKATKEARDSRDTAKPN